MTGKKIRMERIIDRNTGKTIIIPMDHGVSDGPIAGLADMGRAVDAVAGGGATDKNDKVLVNTVERAMKMGADGVSIHVNIGSKTESQQLAAMGEVSGKCLEWGMPLLAMMYPRGEGLTHDEKSPEMVKLAARIGAELGADIVKTYYTGDPESMREVVQGTPIPVVIAGGSRLSDKETLEMIRGAMDAGCAGLSMGRNAFQHENPERFVAAAAKIVHGDASVEEALAFLQG